jgi:hypothetical protein
MKTSLVGAVLWSSVIAFTTAGAVACGDVYADVEDNDSEGSIGGISVDAGFPSMAPPETPLSCPGARPRENGPCSNFGSSCEYGKSADPECNSTLACRGAPSGGAWEPRTADPCWQNACPKDADVAALDGKPCSLPSDGGVVSDVDEAVCNVPDGVCACTTGRDGKTAHARMWVCVRPISVCPANRPLAGQPCSGGLWCDYGSCSFKRGLLMECKDGLWLPGGAPCQ